VLAAVDGLVKRATSIKELRSKTRKEGRVFSSANLDRMQNAKERICAARDSMQEAHDSLDELCQMGEPKEKGIGADEMRKLRLEVEMLIEDVIA
jgi:hypothetical protein